MAETRYIFVTGGVASCGKSTKKCCMSLKGKERNITVSMEMEKAFLE